MTHNIIKILAVFTLSVFLSTAAIAQEEKLPLKVTETGEAIVMDGKLDESAWQKALMLEIKYEVQPGENIEAPVKTEFFITYDKTNIYAAFKCYEPDMGSIRAHLSDRDKDFGDDFVGLALDTFNDERKNYILWVNPRGVQEDAIMVGPGYDSAFDTIYDASVGLYDWGYVVEMVVPFSSLRFQRAEGSQIWGIDAWRNRPREKMTIMGLFPRDRNNNCYQCQMLKIEGFEGITPGRNIQLSPTFTAAKRDERSSMPDGEFQNVHEKGDLGFTGQWGITPNMTLSTTLNPDFSQVEADARQLDINQPFALYFQEKRPFFTEGSDYFNTPMNAIYTRSLREPEWGVKLTGKEGTHSVGAFYVEDEYSNLLLPGSQFSRTKSRRIKSEATVLRYKKDFSSNYTLGAMVTNRESEDYYNRTIGLDSKLRFTDKDDLNIHYMGSFTQYPDDIAADFGQEQGEFSDSALSMRYAHGTRNYNFVAVYRDFGEGFRADLGFIPKVGFREIQVGGDYTWIAGPGKWWTSLNFATTYINQEDKNGFPLEKGFQSSLSFMGTMNTSSDLIFRNMETTYAGLQYDLASLSGSFFTRPNADIRVGMQFAIGDSLDYANNRLGKSFTLMPTINFSLGDNLRVSIDHSFERMEVNDVRLYTANIFQSILKYQFNTRTYLRSIIQYVNYDYNVDNYLFQQEPKFKGLFNQLLFSYRITPQTVFFLGYSDNWDGNVHYGLTQADKTFFMKIGYSWQL